MVGVAWLVRVWVWVACPLRLGSDLEEISGGGICMLGVLCEQHRSPGMVSGGGGGGARTDMGRADCTRGLGREEVCAAPGLVWSLDGVLGATTTRPE